MTYKVRKKPSVNPNTEDTVFSTNFFSNDLSGETQILNSCSRVWQAANYVSLLWVLLLDVFWVTHDKRWFYLSCANKLEEQYRKEEE